MSNLRRNASATDYDVAVKAIIIGDSGVGKSSLLYRYTDQDWNPHYIATIGVDFKVMTFERSNKVVKLQLWDTAGQERFRTITHSYYRGAHGIMMVFDITSRESFENVSVWMQDVKKFANPLAPMLLVGNKSDCEALRQVTTVEAEALATALGCKYVEVSAKNDTAVDGAFQYLVDKCLEQKLQGPKPTVVVPTRNPIRGLPVDDKKPKKASGCPCS